MRQVAACKISLANIREHTDGKGPFFAILKLRNVFRPLSSSLMLRVRELVHSLKASKAVGLRRHGHFDIGAHKSIGPDRQVLYTTKKGQKRKVLKGGASSRKGLSKR